MVENLLRKQPCVYMMANKRHGTLYIGVTSDVVRRAWQHRTGAADGFTKRYGLDKLVWFEFHETMNDAIKHEKAMKKWLRAWKTSLIDKTNPPWRDLLQDLV